MAASRAIELSYVHMIIPKGLGALVCTLIVGIAQASPRIDNLRCEYLHNPLGVDASHPRLSWEMASAELGQRQTAYQILVASTPTMLDRSQSDRWDSGKVPSDQSNQIAYVGKPLEPRDECFWKVRLWDKDGRPTGWSAPARWTVGLKGSSQWQANWIGVRNPDRNSDNLATPSYLRKGFDVKATRVRRATLYVTALGLYEVHINGQRIGDHLLAPEWTNYFKRVQYQTFDVTKVVSSGENVVGAILGNGWYSGGWQLWQSKLLPIYGDQPYLRVQLEIEGIDGSHQVVNSDRDWKATTHGPLRFSGIYEGETYDAGHEMLGWDKADFDDRSWTPVIVAAPKVGEMDWQRNEPIRVSQLIKPISLKEPKPGVYVFDLGQNIAGWCRYKLRQPARTEATFQYNEVLNPDGTVYMDNLHAGHLSGGDRQIDRFICAGSEGEVFEPHFTYHGFRYVQVTGLKVRPKLSDLTGCVFHSGFAQTGTFLSSAPLLNRLAQNIQWSQRGNMMGVPTDCCQRDERCGYTGDAQFFIPTAVYNFDVAAFYNKWLVDVCEDAQLPDGSFADHAPTFGPGDHWNVGWSDAAIICPYVIWQTYGDTQIIRDHFAAMKKNMELLRKTSPTFVHTLGVGNGDWLNLGGGASGPVIGTAYDAYDSELVAKMADAIGLTADAKTYHRQAEDFATGFAKAFINGDGSIRDSSQTGYALAFTMNLVPAELRKEMVQRFAEEIRRFDFHLATGFIGTPRLLPALHEAGLDNLAYRLLLQQGYPSWLFQVKFGATTMWERWDGWTPDKGYQDSGMNSFNHYAFGSVGEYLYGMVGGIRPEAPGYKKVRIEPVIEPGLDWASVQFKSIYGQVSTKWRRTKVGLELEVDVPANTTAEVYMPKDDGATILHTPADNRFLSHLRHEKSSEVYEVSSGHYRFETSAMKQGSVSAGAGLVH